jgi:hypothetical protein
LSARVIPTGPAPAIIIGFFNTIFSLLMESLAGIHL